MKSEIYVKLSFEFIYNEYLDDKYLKKNLTEYLKTKVIIHNTIQFPNILDKFNNDIHIINNNIPGFLSKIETQYISLQKAKNKIMQISNFINEYGYTDWKSNLKITFNFNKELFIEDYLLKLIPVKFAMLFDENEIWRYFPNRRYNPFFIAVNRIKPVHHYNDTFESFSDFTFLSNNNLSVDFTKRMNKLIFFNSIGGENYHKKSEKIIYLIDYFLNSLYAINNLELNNDLILSFKKKFKLSKNVVNNCQNVDKFEKRFSKIELLYDLETNKSKLEIFFNLFGDVLANKLIETNVRQAKINYDSTLDRLQFKYVDLERGGIFYNDDILHSSINKCFFENCTFYNCEFENCNFKNCQFENCKIEKSYIKDSLINKSCEINNCVITDSTLDNCEIKDSYLRNIILWGYKNNSMKIDTNTVILNIIENGTKPIYQFSG